MKCKATGKINQNAPDIFLICKNVHNHQYNHTNEAMARVKRSQLNKACVSSFTGRYSLYMRYLTEMTESQREFWKAYPSVKSGLLKHCIKKFPPCKDIGDLDKLLRENEYVRNMFGIIDDKPFYRRIVSNETDKAVIFINQATEDASPIGATLFVDGTFKVSPLRCAQVLNLFRTITREDGTQVVRI